MAPAGSLVVSLARNNSEIYSLDLDPAAAMRRGLARALQSFRGALFHETVEGQA